MATRRVSVFLKIETNENNPDALVAFINGAVPDAKVLKLAVDERNVSKNPSPMQPSDRNAAIDKAILDLFDTGAPLTRSRILYMLCDPQSPRDVLYPEPSVTLRIQRLVQKKRLTLVDRGLYALNPRLSLGREQPVRSAPPTQGSPLRSARGKQL